MGGHRMDDLINNDRPAPNLADVVDDVFHVVRATVPRSKVVITVRRCRRELDIVHQTANHDLIRGMALARLGAAQQ